MLTLPHTRGTIGGTGGREARRNNKKKEEVSKLRRGARIGETLRGREALGTPKAGPGEVPSVGRGFSVSCDQRGRGRKIFQVTRHFIFQTKVILGVKNHTSPQHIEINVL